MDVLVVTLWLLGIIISHLLLRRIVEIDNMNQLLLKANDESSHGTVSVRDNFEAVDDEALKQELLEYVTSQDYEMPKPDFEASYPNMMSSSMTQIGIPVPKDTSNVVQRFEGDRDMNTGAFGNLEAYEDAGFAPL
jgi:hypothetical protein